MEDRQNKLDTARSPDSVSLIDLALALSESIKLLVTVPLIVGLVALGASFLMKPAFTATTVLMTPQKSDTAAAALLGSLAGLASSAGIGAQKTAADQWVGLLKSRTVADALVDEYKLLDRYELDYRFEARKELQRRTDIDVGKDGLITLSVDDTDPKVAAAMAKSYVTELTKLSNTIAVTEAGQRRLFFERQLFEARGNLEKANQALQRSGVSPSLVKTDPGAAVEAVAKLRAQIVATEVQVSVLREHVTENNVGLKDLLSQLKSLRAQLAEMQKAETQSGPTSSEEYVNKYRDFKYYETLFELLAKQYEIAKVDEAREGAIIQVVDPAEVPEWKSKPRRAAIAVVATAVALILTILFVLMRQAIRIHRLDPNVARKIDKVILLNRIS